MSDKPIQPKEAQNSPTPLQTAKCNCVVHMSYPAELFYSWSEVDAEIQRVAGPSYATTLSQGKREHSWYGRSETEARKLVDQLKALGVDGSEVEFREI